MSKDFEFPIAVFISENSISVDTHVPIISLFFGVGKFQEIIFSDPDKLEYRVPNQKLEFISEINSELQKHFFRYFLMT